MPRLDLERQEQLEPQRMEYAAEKLHELGFCELNFPSEKCIQFIFKGQIVTFWPYTGWHSGKSIKDGRGLQRLLNQLK